MATEKDKKIAGIFAKVVHCDDEATLEPIHGYFCNFGKHVWDAARADAIEECAQFVDDYDHIETYGGYYNTDDARATLMKCAAALRSLSRKQEEPQ